MLSENACKHLSMQNLVSKIGNFKSGFFPDFPVPVFSRNFLVRVRNFLVKFLLIHFCFINHVIFIRPKKWHQVLPRPSPPTEKVREKTGTGKSGKNPDPKFRVFLIRFLLMNIEMGQILRNKENIL